MAFLRCAHVLLLVNFFMIDSLEFFLVFDRDSRAATTIGVFAQSLRHAVHKKWIVFK